MQIWGIKSEVRREVSKKGRFGVRSEAQYKQGSASVENNAGGHAYDALLSRARFELVRLWRNKSVPSD